MAEDRDQEEQDAAAPKKGGAKKLILIILGVLALIGIAVGASIYATKTMLATAENGGEPANTGQGQDNEGGEAKEPKGPEIYYAFDPPFVVNFEGRSGVRFLQVGIEVMTRDKAVVEAIEEHMPVIRNNMLLLLSSTSFEKLSTLEGKQKIRQGLLEEIQGVLKERIDQPGVEEVYFTSFVMQ